MYEITNKIILKKYKEEMEQIITNELKIYSKLEICNFLRNILNNKEVNISNEHLNILERNLEIFSLKLNNFSYDSNYIEIKNQIEEIIFSKNSNKKILDDFDNWNLLNNKTKNLLQGLISFDFAYDFKTQMFLKEISLINEYELIKFDFDNSTDIFEIFGNKNFYIRPILNYISIHNEELNEVGYIDKKVFNKKIFENLSKNIYQNINV